ncbi:nucleotide pyrophosphohydrolase [Vibrio sinaloensis]|uniref:nucleotide pyrophosphohydrolase n=1 Tax=Photobacterium sp. (strain ATCC 43367) TaxID=379097 RepID=UPI0035EC673C
MNSVVYIAGSFEHLDKMGAVKAQLMAAGIETLISAPDQSQGIEGCLARICQADVIYILNFGGYVGKSVAMDIGYALGKEKTVYALEAIDDPDITHLIDGTLNPQQLISMLGESQL